MLGDTHVITWKPIKELNNPIQNQDCYRPEYSTLVKNEFVLYKTSVRQGRILYVSICLVNDR